MWILHLFKETFNNSFDYFIQKVKGRFLAFAIQLLLSYLAVAIFTFLVTTVILTAIYPGGFSFNVFSLDGLYEWVILIDPVWVVTIVIPMNYLFRANLSDTTISFPDFYKGKSNAFWLDLVIAVVIISVVFTIYNKNTFLFSYGSVDPLSRLLHYGFENYESYFEDFLKSWMDYIVTALPIIGVVVIEVRERKRNGRVLKLALWKIILAVILLSLIVNWTFSNLIYMFDNLVMNLLRAPFEMIEIPMILGVVAIVLFKTLNFLALVTIIHFAVQSGMDDRLKPELDSTNSNDLLSI